MFNPPRWSLQWWKNLIERARGTVVRKVRGRLLGIFWRVWKAYFAEHYWIKRTGKVNAAAEIAALRYLRKHTSIPVPRPYFSCQLDDMTWIFMDRVDGVPLDDVIVQSTQEQRESYVRQVADMLAKLRGLQTPFGSAICSASGSQVMLKDAIGGKPYGPFSSEDEFNKAICMPHRLSLPPNALCHDITHPIVFTHGDLAPYNIMVKDGRIAAIIDWETAGWFPSSWEYIQTHHSNWEGRGLESRDIFRSYIPCMMPSYPQELEANNKYAKN